ncbi:MAG: hypothetical protein Kow00117_05680 [Phototrophicales bacterium]
MMNIRQATQADLPGIRHLWQEYITILSQADARFKPLLQTTAEWEARLLERIEHVYICEKDGKIIGYLAGDATETLATIDEIALDAHTYHSGLGRALVNAWYRAHPNLPLRVHVPRYHAVEQAFWRALGAKEVHTWQTPPEKIWMILSSDQR